MIENFLGKLKQYRSIATRCDKTECNFFGAIYLSASVIWLNDDTRKVTLKFRLSAGRV